VSIQARMSALSARTLVCAPRLSFLVVSLENQRSTTFSQELGVGVKCTTNLACASQRWMAGVLCVEPIVHHQVHGQVGWDLAVDGGEKLLELDRPMPRVQPADHPSSGDVQRGIEAGGAIALVVVRGTLRRPGQHRQRRGGPVQRLDLRLLVHA